MYIMMVIYTRQARSLRLKNDDYYIRTYFYYTFEN